MNRNLKKAIIIILSLLLIFFCYKLYLNLTLIEKPGYYDFERSNIQEKIVDDKKILTEKNLGITMQIPKNWEYEKYWDGLVVKDPDLNVESLITDSKNWTKGCSLAFFTEQKGVFSENSWYDDERQRLSALKQGQDACIYDRCEFIQINEMEGLKDVYELEEINFDGKIEHVFLTFFDVKKKRLYKIESFLSTQVPECREHLNDFINNLEIK
jgi:hypothetical protein